MNPVEETGTLEVTQYKRLDGRKAAVYVDDVPKRFIDMAKDMVLSAEVLPTGQVAVYVRFDDEPEESELIRLAQNGPGENNPTDCLLELIEDKFLARELGA